MRICLVAELYLPNLGGLEFALGNIVEGLAEQGVAVTVVTSRFDHKLPMREEKPGVTVVRVPVFPFLKRFWFVLFSLPVVFVQARRCDLIQGSTFAGAVPACLVALVLRKRCVLLVHEIMGKDWFRFEPNILKSTFYWFTERIIVHLPFDRCIAVSNHTRRCLVADGVPDQKIEVIYHGDSRLEDSAIDRAVVRADLGFGASDYVYFVSGRTGVSKGIEHLVAAMPGIARRVPSARFLLILSKYDRRIWKEISRGLSELPSSLYRLLPPVSRQTLAHYLSAVDCIVIPSLSEGFGFTAREACNARKVVVSTNAGALPEVIDGEHVFVRPGSVEALVEGCRKAFQGEVESCQPKEFSWQTTIAKYKDLYDRLTSPSGR